MNHRQRALAERMASDIGAIIESVHGIEISVFIVRSISEKREVVVVSRDKNYSRVYLERVYQSVNGAKGSAEWFTLDPAWAIVNKHAEAINA